MESKSSRMAGTISVLVVTIGILVLGLAAGPSLIWSFDSAAPRNDFISFYAAGRLLASGMLYDIDGTTEEHVRLSVRPDQHKMTFLRPPFYALLMAPLGKFDYPTAYVLWQVGSVMAFLGAVILWEHMNGKLAAVVAAWHLPMAFTLLRGQDIAFMLLVISIATCLLKYNRQVGAGITLSLCAAKWSLFLTVPILLVRRRLWRTLFAFTVGVGILLFVSFAIGGSEWVPQYWATIMRPSAAPHQEEMASLNGLVAGLPCSPVLEGILIALVVSLTWLTAAAKRVDYAMAGMLLGGVLVSHHAYLYDCVLIFPATIVASDRQNGTALRVAGLLLIVPIFFALLLFPPLSRIPQLGLLALAILMALQSARRDGATVRPVRQEMLK